MKIHEAIAMLEQMDPNKECTVTFGIAEKRIKLDPKPYNTHYPQQPVWVIGKEFWPKNPNEVTCKVH